MLRLNSVFTGGKLGGNKIEDAEANPAQASELGIFQLPIPFDGGAPFVLPHYKKSGPIDPSIFTWEKFFRFIMKPQVTPESHLFKESKDSIEEYQSQQVSKAFTKALEERVNDDDDHVYTNSLNEIDMDNISRDRQSNVTILDNSNLQTDGTFLMKWNNSSVPENWWSVCKLPVIVILFGVIGVLAISFIVVLWFKKHMIRNSKEGSPTPSGENSTEENQLMSTACPFPSPSPATVPEEQWIHDTVIDLNNPIEGPTEEAVRVQPQDTVTELMSQPVKEMEKKPEGLKMKAKGLLERRGSSASLTIDLTQNTLDTKLPLFTPTQECSSEEYLLSAANVLTRAQLKNSLRNVQGLHSEFWEIPLNHPEKSEVTGSGMKNRYETILPNERTRVKLEVVSDNPLDSYINANYIRGYDGEEKAYIATQGPLSNTVQDLYQMAWNDNCPIIVMMTKLYEKAKIKCEPYFPMEANESIKYGEYDVTVLTIQPKEGYTVRELLVRKNEESRLILHYWYDTWPDHKTPQDANSIVAMATEIEKYRAELKNSTCLDITNKYKIGFGPVIVHCSAGIGRTGCFIAICIGMNQIKAENKVDVLGIVCQMRYDRGGMIQTAEQYEFVHQAISDFAQTLPEQSGD